jgi:lycopene cyclase
VVHRWPHHTVLFTKRRRLVKGGYASISAAQFHTVLAQSLCPHSIHLNTPIVHLSPQAVYLADGQTVRADAVIDGRGFVPSLHLSLRFQKFVGQELRLHHPHRLSSPVLMDARVPQQDGYRFVYVLPLTPRTLLVEDTYFADTAQLDAATLRQRLHAYAFAQGWVVDEVLREEQGVLPITLDGDINAFWRELRGQPVSGLRAALCHPTTGYSLPSAVRLADRIAQLQNLSAPALYSTIETHAVEAWRAQAFFRALNRMLFLAARRLQDYVELLPVNPLYRLCWEDGDVFNYVNDQAALEAQIAARNLEDVQGYRRFLDYSRALFKTGYQEMGAMPFTSWRDMVRAAPAIVRLGGWRSVHDAVAGFIRDERLRQAFSFHSLLVGGNLFRTSAIYALIHALERQWGVWFARGGTGALVRALAGEAVRPWPCQAFAYVARLHHIPTRLALEHLNGFRQDAQPRTYPTLADTLHYCWGVAGVVGVMMALMMGARNDTALDRAADLGLAFQLTNIARDVLDDAACGRIYLPTQWLHAHGIAVHAVAEPQHRDVLVQVAQQLLAHAQPYYASAYRGLRQLPVRSAWAVAQCTAHLLRYWYTSAGPWRTCMGTTRNQYARAKTIAHRCWCG